MDNPVDKEAVERLRGTITYLARFVPKLTDVFRPIGLLAQRDADWNWGAAQEKAFSKLKQLLTEAPTLAYFNPAKQLVIQCDASTLGLGAALLKDNRSIAYASRALTNTETRYAVIEKEMLAIVFALEKWHQFTYGRSVVVNSDHKPLEAITKKYLDKAPKRLQGMLLRALAYDVEVKYMQGKKMFLADTLSRAFLPAKNVPTQAEFETINAITFLPMREESISKIRDETERDESLQTLKRVIQQGWPHDKANVTSLAAPYYHFRGELAVTDGLIFGGERLVIPGTMRPEIKKNMHLGHTGIEGCLRRARESVYWPGMTSEIKEWIKTCETCQEYDNTQTKETLMSHDMPDRLWQKVGVDLFSYMGKDYLVTTDYKSNFWEIDYLSNTSSKSVITKLKAHFAKMGIPDTVVSDNGPQFSSSDFAHFSKKWGFEHTPSSPHHSRLNGKVESSVKSAKKMIRKAKKCGEDQYLALLNIRNTPESRHGQQSCPATSRTKNKDDHTYSQKLTRVTIFRNETRNGSTEDDPKTTTRYYDRSARYLPTLHEGDTVRMKPFRLGDKSWKKANVVERLDDRSYEVEDTDGTMYRRNRVHLKKTCDAPPSSGMPLAEPPVENTPPTPGRPPPQNVARNSPPSNPRRSSRTTNVPAKYKDFVLAK